MNTDFDPRFSTPNILSRAEAKEFYVEFDSTNLRMGLVGEAAFMDAIHNCNIDLQYIGIASAWGGNAEWGYCPRGKAAFLCHSNV